MLQSGIELPYIAIRRLIGESIDLVLHLERRRGSRIVAATVRVAGFRADQDAYELETPTVVSRFPTVCPHETS